VTVTGQIQCSQDLQASIGLDLTQVVGRFWTISGGGGTGVECLEAEGTADFSLTFYPWSGKFAPGHARIQGYADTYMCTGEPDAEECFYDSVAIGPMNVRLTR
jgi:hypothetical protein